MASSIIQTCTTLSSATDASTQSSVSDHEKSETLDVWPPWMKSSSGGPSSASSSSCSSPMRATSQTMTLRSAPQLANTDGEKGAHATPVASSMCPWKVCTGALNERMSHSFTVLSVLALSTR